MPCFALQLTELLLQPKLTVGALDGGEAQNMNTISFSLQYKSGNSWKTAKSITNNSAAVTDVILDQPVTAQEWRLLINNSGSSAWGAIRIYEWQMFESAAQEATEPVLMKFASAVNNPGATDTFTLRNVPASTTVKLYLKDGESYRQIAEKSDSGTVNFADLDFGSKAGRVFYSTTTDNYAESIKLSTPYDAEEVSIFSITVVQPENGTVTASSSSAEAGATVTLTATPKDSYELEYFTLDGSQIEGNSFVMPEEDVTVSAIFRPIQQEDRVNLAENAEILSYNRYYSNIKETGPAKLFDGDRKSKWTVSGANCWVVFDISEAADIDTMKVFHAGSAGEDWKLNTASYDLYILNEQLIKEDVFAALSASEQARICSIARYWTKILAKTDNSADVTEDSIALDHARRYFKFNARKTNSLGRSYSVNIYELEMYASSNEPAF